MSDPTNPYQSPTPTPADSPFRQAGQGDATGGLIPYKNVPALTAYYLGILSLVCCFFGLPLGIVPVVLGVLGLQKRARQPEVKGSVHAWIGIVCGILSTLGAVLILISIAAAIMDGPRR
jgi:hypothetical protein